MIKTALVSGSIAAVATSLVAALCGRAATGSYAAPLNATSHIAWGERAARRDDASLQYTGTGLALNWGACLFWALAYESLRRAGPPPARAALVSAAAYVVDYHVVPRRLTPGFELRLGKAGLAAIYAALTLGLCARDAVTGEISTRG
jgi:hypothetical protein